MSHPYATVPEFTAFLTQIQVFTDVQDDFWPTSSVLEANLEMAAGEINMALVSSDQLSCVVSGNTSHGIDDMLKLLNIIGATLITEFSNVRELPVTTLERYQQWKDNIIEKITDGVMAICDGETGKGYPAFATAEQASTPFAGRDIILNEWLRNLNT